ncbi:MAG: chemotaxis protein CheW [Candidatus Omnitrophota bacterium]
MTKNSESRTGLAVDQGEFDRLMDLSGQLAVIRAQYVRIERLLRKDLARQKELAQVVEAVKALMGVVAKEPSRTTKVIMDLSKLVEGLQALSKYDDALKHMQGVGHTTSSLEKASSELQSGIIKLRGAVLGGDANASLAMSIVSALLVVVGEEICAFPLSTVNEIVNVSSKDIYTVDGNATMKLREHALSLIELSKIIRFEKNVQSDSDQTRRIVVISNGVERIGVIVDSLLGKDEIVLKSLTKHFSNVKGIVGASILADGNVALVLDSAAIIQASKQ